MQDLTTYFDNTRYDNLNSLTDKGEIKPDGLSAKPAKLSAFAILKAKTDKIKEDLSSQNNLNQENPEVDTTPEVNNEVPNEVTAESTSETNVEPTVEETPKYDFPSKEVMDARIHDKVVTIYNDFQESKVISQARKLRVAPQVTESGKYTMNVCGVDFVQNNELENTEIEPEMTTEISETENQEPMTTEETQQETTFDFSALPGVNEAGDYTDNYVDQDETYDNKEYSEQEGMPYEENYHTEQDDRLNNYLNRENYGDNVDYSNNFDELEEIRKLKREIEEARESLMQVKQNVGDLQQKDNAISEQLAAYKRSLMQERDAVNAELVDQTREWNDLTQLVRQKEELIGDDESYGMSRAA